MSKFNAGSSTLEVYCVVHEWCLPVSSYIRSYTNKIYIIRSAAGELKINELKGDWWAKEFEKILLAPERYNFLIETCKVAAHNGRAFFLPSHQ